MGKRKVSQRQLRVGETLRHSLAEILLRMDWYHGGLSGRNISISEVSLSPDLKVADVYVSWLIRPDESPAEEEKKQFVRALNAHSWQLRLALGKKVYLKSTPELRFAWDHTVDNSKKINALINNLSS